MTKQATTQPQPLDPNTITQPFDLATAIAYMREHGEVIRGQTGGQNFYMSLDVQRRPVFVKGKRVFKDIETITGVYQWGGAVTTLPLTDLFGDRYHIMNFDENGQPIWDEPTAVISEEG